MSLRSDHKALIFVGVVAVLGAGVRVVRAAGRESSSRVQPALDVQARAADSAASAHRDGRNGQGRGTGRGKGRGRSGRASSDTAQKTLSPGGGPLDHTGYIGGKLDLDVATATQIASLPGVASGMAKRIVADRMMRGPFLSRDGLRRVSGAGPRFLQQIDSLVVFSGTFATPATSDTVIPRQKAKRSKVPTRPAVQRTTVRRRVPWLHAASDSYWPAPESRASRRRVT